MKRSPLRKIGQIGRSNIAARKRIAEIAEERNLTACELRLPGCLIRFPLAPAHRHKRAWYRGDASRIAAYEQWVAACQHCHDRIENDAALTEELFMRLRGAE